MHKSVKWVPLVFILLWALTGAWAVIDSASLPFHPDESTQLYMSADLGELLTHPLQMAWVPGQTVETSPQVRYRLLDAPLTRYLLGIARWITNQPPLAQDWNWSLSWEQNRTGGALPDAALLTAGRVIIALLLPFSTLLLYLAGKRLGGTLAGALSAAALILNGLVLLHARRAMAEGALLFGICLVIYCLAARKPAWALGVAFALAFNAKQSAAVLLPVCLIAILWPAGHPRRSLRPVLVNLGVFLGAAGLLTVLLNPFLWRSPLQALQTAYQARQTLLAGQLAEYRQSAPQKVIATPVERAITLTLETFIAPPSFSEAGNYLDQTRASEENYLANPLHSAQRGIIPGAIVFILFVFGAVIWIRRIFTRSTDHPTRRELALIAIAGVSQWLGLVLTVPLDFQRYVVPLTPFAALGVGYGLSQLINLFTASFRRGKPDPSDSISLQR